MTSNDAANDEEWAQAEGVPSLSDPFIQKYLQGRDALVQQEKRQRSGWSTHLIRNTHEHVSDSHQTISFARTSRPWHKRHVR